MSNDLTSTETQTPVTFDAFIEEMRALAKLRGLSGFSIVAACGESAMLITDTDKDPVEALGLLKMCEVAVAQGLDALIQQISVKTGASIEAVQAFADQIIEDAHVKGEVNIKPRRKNGAQA